MKTFIAVPNGIFPLKEVLAAPTTKQIIETLRNETRADGRKLRIFLSFYQTLTWWPSFKYKVLILKH